MFILAVFLVSLRLITFSDALFEEVFRVNQRTGVKVMDFWKQTGVHCGSNMTVSEVYRHDYIDRIDVNCIRAVFVYWKRNADKLLYWKYTTPTSANLETLLSTRPNYVQPADRLTTYASDTTDQYLVNNGNYELLNINGTGTTFYAGIYYNQSDINNCPLFPYNNLGTPYTANQDPLTFDNIQTADYFNVYLDIDGIQDCPFTSQVPNQPSCLDVPAVSVQNKSYELTLGNSLTLNCSFNAFPPASSVIWRIGGTNISDSCDITRRFSGATISTPSLTLTNGQTCDITTYECCVSNAQGQSCSDLISVGMKPIVTLPTMSYVFINGVSETINCSVNANPPLTSMEWHITTDSGSVVYQGTTSTTYSGSQPNNPSLTLLSPRLTDSGQYICTATNSIGTTSSNPVNVMVYGVSATVYTTSYTAIYGDNIELNCTAHGVPTITQVRWQFVNNGSDIDMTNTAKYSGSTVNNPSLRITGVTFEDMVKYQCVVVNDYDKNISSAVTLIVTGAKPHVTTNQQYITANTSQSITLNCQVTGSPTVQSVYWRMTDGVTYSVVPGTTTGGTVTSPSLVISSVDNNHHGLFVCFAVNAVGETRSTVINVTVINQEPMCPCSCEYKERLDYWAAQNTTNHTIDEWREILAPVIAKLEKELKVDTSNISATLNKLRSAKDSRTSSQSLGMMGIVFLCLVFGGIILIDISSCFKGPSSCKKSN